MRCAVCIVFYMEQEIIFIAHVWGSGLGGRSSPYVKIHAKRLTEKYHISEKVQLWEVWLRLPACSKRVKPGIY